MRKKKQGRILLQAVYQRIRSRPEQQNNVDQELLPASQVKKPCVKAVQAGIFVEGLQ